jgi:HK97 family phage major capsid protein
MSEIKELADGLKADWENFKKTHTESLKAKAEGKAVAEIEAKLAEINKAIDAKTAQLDKIETAIKRSAVGGSEHNKEPGEKVLRKAFRSWMSKGAANSTLSDAIMGVLESDTALKEAYIDAHPECKALAVADDTQGGFMVHADLSGRIIKRIFETSPIRQYANVQTISTDALEGPMDADQAAAEWVAEQGSRAVTANPKIGMWRIPTHELYAMPAATQKLLDDAAWDPEAWLATKVADKFARTENAAFVLGSGDGKPKALGTDRDGSGGSHAPLNDGNGFEGGGGRMGGGGATGRWDDDTATDSGDGGGD